MKHKVLRSTAMKLALLLTLTIIADKSFANQAQKLGVFSDWVAFRDNEPSCWAATSPVDGSYKRSRNSPKLLMVFSQPDADVEGQVGVTVGYKVNASSHIEISTNSMVLRLNFTKEKEWAFPRNSQEDARLVKAFMRGNEAVVKVIDGQKVLDWYKFSLRGFTSAFGTSTASCRR